jgi:hypothetical protein
MISVAAVALVTITVILFLMFEQSNKDQTHAQNQTQGTDFAQLFSTEEFMAPDCTNPVLCKVPPIEVLYQDSALLVLSSNYVDFIWKGVARAQQEGYQVDDVTSYTASEAPNGPMQVNLLVSIPIG